MVDDDDGIVRDKEKKEEKVRRTKGEKRTLLYEIDGKVIYRS